MVRDASRWRSEGNVPGGKLLSTLPPTRLLNLVWGFSRREGSRKEEVWEGREEGGTHAKEGLPSVVDLWLGLLLFLVLDKRGRLESVEFVLVCLLFDEAGHLVFVGWGGSLGGASVNRTRLEVNHRRKQIIDHDYFSI